MQRTVFSAFQKCHFELQNVCKAENVLKGLKICAMHVILLC